MIAPKTTRSEALNWWIMILGKRTGSTGSCAATDSQKIVTVIIRETKPRARRPNYRSLGTLGAPRAQFDAISILEDPGSPPHVSNKFYDTSEKLVGDSLLVEHSLRIDGPGDFICMA